MSFVASFPGGLEACFVCDLVCECFRVSLWLRSPVASKKVSFVVSYSRGRTLHSGAASEGFPGRYREALRNFWAPKGVSWDASGTSWGGFWELLGPLEPPLVLRGRLREALGCFQSISERLLGAPETPWGASRGAFGTSREAFWGSERALGADKT